MIKYLKAFWLFISPWRYDFFRTERVHKITGRHQRLVRNPDTLGSWETSTIWEDVPEDDNL